MIPPLSRSYVDARAAFLDAADGAAARVTSTLHPRHGVEDEELYVDVAEIGPDGPGDVVVVVSGTHGVEGFLGSALQRLHLTEHLTGREHHGESGSLVLVHALNPYGFSWVRRVNEDNVDLNRNFVDWSRPAPRNDEYGELADVLVPASWSDEAQQQSLLALLGKLEEVGMARLQQTISGGQYDHPTGVFYGGTGPTWSHRWLREFLGRRLADARRAVIVDLHTGLGPRGHGELIGSNAPGSPEYERQRACWGDVTSLVDGTSVSAEVAGDWLGAAAGFAPATEITAIAIEYGTVDPITVLQSLRADAVLHAHGNPAAPEAGAIRDQVRAAFADDDPAWLDACWSRYRWVVDAAFDHLA